MPIANAPAVQAGREQKKAAGGRLGGPAPYGYRWHRGELLPVEPEQHVIWLARHLYGRGWSLQRIADAFYGLGLAPRSGARWRRDAIHRLVAGAVLRERSSAQQQQITDTG